MRRAVFLDLNGTLVEPLKPERLDQLVLMPDVVGSVARLTAAGFVSADSYYPQSGSAKVTEASALTKRRDATSPAQSFLASWQAGCRFGGAHFVAGMRAGQRPAPDDKRE